MTSGEQPDASPFSIAGPRVHEQGFRPIPILPVVGTGSPGRGKAPGACEPINGSLVGVWEGMKGWQEWANKDLPEEQVAHWATYPNANVGVLLDRTIGAVDIDVDDAEVQAAAMACLTGLGGEIVQKVGGKGFTVFFRQPDSGPIENASYSYADGVRAVDLLSMGRQTVIPPSEHITGKRYRWLTPETLEGVEASELPQVTDDFPEILREALRPLKIFKGNGSRARGGKRAASSTQGTTAGAEGVEVDLDPMTQRPRRGDGWMDDVNTRALRPEELRKWAPALDLPKFHERGGGSFRAVASWRPSSTGRPIEQRSPNLGIHPTGIEDFGSGETFTPIDLVMAAMDISNAKDAVDWLRDKMDADIGIPSIETLAAAQGQAGVLQVVRESDGGFDDDDEGDSGVGKWWGEYSIKDYYEEFPSDPGPFPEEAVRNLMGGVLGDLTEFIERTSPSPSFHCAFGAALSFLSVAAGQKYGVGSTRTNMYIVLVGESGLGKTAATDILNFVIEHGGQPCLEPLMGPADMTSDAALVKLVRSRGRVLMSWDEFGHKLKKFNNKNAGSWESKAIMRMTEFYSVSAGIWRGVAYAGDREDEEPIYSPHLCFYGSSTEAQFWDAITSRNLEDGSLARYQIIDAGPELPQLPDEEPEAPTAKEATGLADRLAAIVHGPEPDDAASLAGRAPAYQVPLPDNIKSDRYERRGRYRALANVTKSKGIIGAGPLIQRSLELATKIAMISAISRNHLAPVVSDEDWALGLLLANWSISRMIASVYDKVSETDQEAMSKDIEQYIKKNPKGVSKMQISNAKRKYKKRDRDEALEDLIDGGIIYREKVTVKGGMEEWRLFHKDRKPNIRIVK